MFIRDFETDKDLLGFCAKQSVYDFMGAHDCGAFVRFRFFAPEADAVYLVASFNEWSDNTLMSRCGYDGVWEACVPREEMRVGDTYKYKLYVNGRVFYKTDPYARMATSFPYYNAVICDEAEYSWRDGVWLSRRAETYGQENSNYPMHIYEIELCNWKRHDDGGFLSYTELADEIVPYLKQMGYTHVLITGLFERCFDDQSQSETVEYYAPTSKHGTPQDFMRLVDHAHTCGIGVLLDWSIRKKDLTDENVKKLRLCGNNFESYLLSNLIYWADKYHIDGIKTPSICPERASFFHDIAWHMKELMPDFLMIADGRGDFLKKLGFDIIFNNAWSDATMSYIEKDIDVRSVDDIVSYDTCCQGGLIAISDKHVLPGRKTLIGKMTGDYWRKFAGARATLAYQMMSRGKKLTVMGSEIGQYKEWGSEVEWHLLEYDNHAAFQLYCSDLNALYLKCPQLWYEDGENNCCAPTKVSDNVICIKSCSCDGRELAAVINFSYYTYENFCISVDRPGLWREIFNSDSKKYGGSGINNKEASVLSYLTDSGEYALKITVPPLAVTVFECLVK